MNFHFTWQSEYDPKPKLMTIWDPWSWNRRLRLDFNLESSNQDFGAASAQEQDNFEDTTSVQDMSDIASSVDDGDHEIDIKDGMDVRVD